MTDREILSENDESMLFLTEDFYDKALIGHAQRDGVCVAVYDVDKIIEALIQQGASEIDSLEHFDYNILGSHVGEYTPIYVYPILK